jgi:hypothetical protein
MNYSLLNSRGASPMPEGSLVLSGGILIAYENFKLFLVVL